MFEEFPLPSLHRNKRLMLLFAIRFIRRLIYIFFFYRALDQSDERVYLQYICDYVMCNESHWPLIIDVYGQHNQNSSY